METMMVKRMVKKMAPSKASRTEPSMATRMVKTMASRMAPLKASRTEPSMV